MAACRDDALSAFPHLRAAALAALPVVEEARACRGGPVELEARLGRCLATGHFEADVGPTLFGEVLQLLQSYPRWQSSGDWEEIRDVFYPIERREAARAPELAEALHGIEGGRLQVRTTVTPDPDGLRATHVAKLPLRSASAALQLLDPESCSQAPASTTPLTGLDVRISASLELPVPTACIPACVRPDLVRIKQRRTFGLATAGVPGECFVFHASRVFAAPSYVAAEKLLREDRPTSHEVECECCAARAYLAACNGQTTLLALSLLLKMQDFAAHLHGGAVVSYVPQRS